MGSREEVGSREQEQSSIPYSPLPTPPNPLPSNRDIYIAASRIIMRCVVILFAEARDLLPRDNPIYHNSYGIQGLREQLDRMAGGRASERLRNQFGAWARLLGLFRLVYAGSPHQALPVPRYGGGLFTPGDAHSTDPVLRSLSAFENPNHAPSDAVVYRILEMLCRSRVKVRQGRRSTWVEAPVDFSDLSSEYIGILYEGLLDFELRRAAEDEPMVFLNLGDQPALPLSRLEGMDDKALVSLVEKLKSRESGDEGNEGESPEDEQESEIENAESEIDADSDPADDSQRTTNEDDDSQGTNDFTKDLRNRAYQWAIRAVKAGNLVSKPRSKKADALAAYEQQVGKMAERLIARVILPGEWFLVRWGGTRKGSGTFYTRPQLAVPTVQRTLEPLVHTTKSPAEILSLKICDPACGSASFLIAALRYLTNALWESLFEYGWLIEEGDRIREGIPKNAQPEWFVECVKDFPLSLEKAEEFSKPRLKRYVVERCIYGVDINPLGVELGRLALWVETMDRSLPFGFLDHKLKCGNSLVGCWFDQFQDYPIMAWEREAGDRTHKGVHFAKDVWTKEIKRLRNEIVRDELKELLTGVQLSIFEDRLIQPPEKTHDELLASVEQIHAEVLSPERQAQDYERSVRQKDALRQLKWAFDCWCAVWFWQGSDLTIAPTPMQFVNPSPEVYEAVQRIAQDYQFFHWELEFPDVFSTGIGNRELGVGSGGEDQPHSPLPTALPIPGFDAIVGNPPWETLQPNSKEFFSNIDPLYRTYGKQEALEYQQRYFEADPRIEKDWLAYCANFKALANWSKFSAYAFGDNEAAGSTFSLSRKKKEAELLQADWQSKRSTRKGYSDPEHPFRYQGEGKPYTYKMFTELAHALLRKGGRLSLVIPSGLYTDKGASNLRNLFLNRCEWTHLYAFQNERFVFGAIHHSFKMLVLSVNKGRHTKYIETRFRLGPGDSPEAQELETDILNDSHYLSVPATQIKRFSPNTGALLEIRTEQDLKILEKMYSNGVLLGDNSPQGWGIQYRQGDFNMTSDSKLFPPRPKWEEKGYRPDEYGHWLKGNWQPYGGESGIGSRESGVILSADGSEAIAINEVEDVALPLMQGGMLHQFDFSQKGWVSGTGLRAIWKPITWENKRLEPQFLMDAKHFERETVGISKPVVRRIARNTDTRMMISGYIPAIPCSDVASVLLPLSESIRPDLVGCLNSFVCDYITRTRCGGTHVDYHYIADVPLPRPVLVKEIEVGFLTLRLAGAHCIFANDWLKFKKTQTNRLWKELWAITPYERLCLRCILDAVIAELYGLDLQDFAWILQGCDHPSKQVCDSTFARTLEPKGFWRVDKEKDPELRHTVLSLIAFNDLKRLGLDAFLNLNNGDGWMLPETLRLADYGLGHDDRAKEHQPVAARIGAETAKQWEEEGSREAAGSYSPLHYQYRFLPWQLQGTPEESWAECERHAENLRLLLGDRNVVSENDATDDLGDSSVVNRRSQAEEQPPTPHTPHPTPHAPPQQLDLFNTPDP